MLLQYWSISSCGAFHNSWDVTHSGKHHSLIFNKRLCLEKSRKSAPFCLKAQLVDELAQLGHNKVLVAAGVCGLIGQLSKPFTNVILYGKEFDFKSTLQAGGFPSSHSSTMVATATMLGLERGLSDSIFGLSVVYAGIVMYDAQGVRREAGNHARVLNKTLSQITRVNSIPSQDRGRLNSQPKTSSSLQLDRLKSLAKSFSSKATNAPLLSKSITKMSETTQTQIMSSGLGTDAEGLEIAGSYTPLKETIGHTEVEVAAGALLGFLVSLAVYITL
ncbi:PREDICTED: uncharacterized protein LOC101291316 [Fragaria vesca subsp. vesca]|uniref:uncharacterized protein LOC101291316 n=1 Tax=Fragaria vesca subsp. vesca TaxID=101020 RepID=UPI0002C35528|nr:PREDICTED: uncharacterized protein LOC101291316 [Fragaria vesca subsp. vesca]